MKTLLAWVGGIAIGYLIISGIWNLTCDRGPVPNEQKAEALALRAFVIFQSHHTNAVFAGPWNVTDKGDTWVVSSASGLSAVIEKKTGNSKFGPWQNGNGDAQQQNPELSPAAVAPDEA